jgi:hypothetical protein
VADTEVETILREIRDRVRSEFHAGAAPKSGAASSPSTSDQETSLDTVPHLEASLETVRRAFDRLPPLTSNRMGLLGRLELWFKRRIRSATHWYTWEQVNFNQAAAQSLQEVASQLAACRHELNRLGNEVNGTSRDTPRLTATGHNPEGPAAFDIIGPDIPDSRCQHEAQIEQFMEEHRVTFKQLALEMGEIAKSVDRVRRSTETRIDELGRRVQDLGSETKSRRG